MHHRPAGLLRIAAFPCSCWEAAPLAPLLDEANANYGGNIIVWDVVFRTRLLPEGRRAPDAIGLSGGGAPDTFFGQLAMPFRPPG